MEISTIGFDLAKQVFQVHGIDRDGRVVVRRRLRRCDVIAFFRGLAPALVGLEACSTSHYWARQLRALGHEVRLIPAQYVKPYVKRQKNDAADAEAICEAVTRPSMRFVPVKTADQQSAVMLQRTRDLLVSQRTMLVNALRGHLAELGIVVARGRKNVPALMAELEQSGSEVPDLACQALRPLADQLAAVEKQIEAIEATIVACHKNNETSCRLATIPGIGPIIASALAAAVPDPGVFASGRHFAAWLGLVPRQNSTGGKSRLGRVSKQGDANLRRLLVVGAQSVLRWIKPGKGNPWLVTLLARRPRKLVGVALANKMARIAWALMTRGETYSPPAVA